jgi:competence protein ComGB
MIFKKGYLKLTVEHFSMQFASYYLMLLNQGINTKQCFSLLSSIKDNKILLSITKQCIEDFQKGEDMIYIINRLPFDKTLRKFLLTGHATGTTQLLLDEYLVLADKRFFLHLGKRIKSLQIVIYVIIGIFVITLYQILLLPMQNLAF